MRSFLRWKKAKRKEEKRKEERAKENLDTYRIEQRLQKSSGCGSRKRD